MMIIMPSRGMIIGDQTPGKKVEVEEGDDFPEEEEEEGAWEGGGDASLILFIPTDKTMSKKVEVVKQMRQAKLLLYPNHHLLQVISQVEVEQRWLKCYQQKLGLDLVRWMKDCLLLDKRDKIKITVMDQ